MANQENIEGHKIRSTREAREKGSKGGIASGKARREKKRLRELAQMILEEEITDKATGQVMTQGEAALRVQARRAIMDGDVRALEFLRDTAGQKPVERIESVEIAPEVYERVERALRGE